MPSVERSYEAYHKIRIYRLNNICFSVCDSSFYKQGNIIFNVAYAQTFQFTFWTSSHSWVKVEEMRYFCWLIYESVLVTSHWVEFVKCKAILYIWWEKFKTTDTISDRLSHVKKKEGNNVALWQMEILPKRSTDRCNYSCTFAKRNNCIWPKLTRLLISA